MPRDQSVAALDRLVEEHPVTLVAAPAGSGKTVLMAEWVHQSRAAAIERATHLGLR